MVKRSSIEESTCKGSQSMLDATPRTKQGKQQSGKKTFALRPWIRGGVFALIAAMLAAGFGSGSLCSIGYDAIAAICPLGVLESAIGTRSVAVHAIAAFVAALAVAALFGKAFCGWVCPIPPLERFLSSKKRRKDDKERQTCAARHVAQRAQSGGCDTCGACRSTTKKQLSARIDGRHIVLGGSLASAAIFGFPVFCLVCPIGLTFATFIALYRLIGFNEPTLDLIVFPLIIVAELTVLRRWCHRFCPLGAFMSLFARFSTMTSPRVNTDICLREPETPCVACAAACPEFIDPVGNLGDRPLTECVRCGKCADACPVQAITFSKKGHHHEQRIEQ